MTDTSAVEVRQAVRSDLPAIYRIEALSFDQPWPINAFDAFLGKPAFLVAVGGGDVLGFGVADLTPNHGADIGHLKDLAVEPSSRGQGIGKRLLRSTLSRLTVAGAAVVKLEVRAGNDPARELYRTEGFRPLRQVPEYYDDGETAFVLALDMGTWESDDTDTTAEETADGDAGRS